MININTGNLKSKPTKHFLYEDYSHPSCKRAIIKLKNTNYLLSMIIYVYGAFYNSEEHLINTFNFNPNDIINVIEDYDSTVD